MHSHVRRMKHLHRQSTFHLAWVHPIGICLVLIRPWAQGQPSFPGEGIPGSFPYSHGLHFRRPSLCGCTIHGRIPRIRPLEWFLPPFARWIWPGIFFAYSHHRWFGTEPSSRTHPGQSEVDPGILGTTVADTKGKDSGFRWARRMALVAHQGRREHAEVATKGWHGNSQRERRNERRRHIAW